MPNITHFPNYSIVDGNIRVDIRFDRFSEQFRRAQWLLGNQVLQDCLPYVPILTGSLRQRSHVEDDGKRVVFPGPYARFQYMGKVMVDPETHSPFARPGVKKILTDRPLTYGDPFATDHWFDTARAQHGDYWLKKVKEIAGGG